MAAPFDLMEAQCHDIDGLFEQLVEPGTDHREVLRELTARLAAHISIEHSLILPALRRAGGGDRKFRTELKRDYRRMGHQLTLIERRKINSPDQPDLLSTLRSEWRGHVARHDGLEAIGERMTPSDRRVLSEKVGHAENVILSHPHPHLLALGPLSRLTTRLAARFDRARDRTVSNLP